MGNTFIEYSDKGDTMKIERMRYEELKPFFKKHTWLVRPLAFLLLILSPIIIIIYLIVNNWGEVVKVIEDILSALLYIPKKEKQHD